MARQNGLMSVDIDAKLHIVLKFYCAIHKCTLRDLVEKILKTNGEIQKFSEQMKRMRFS